MGPPSHQRLAPSANPRLPYISLRHLKSMIQFRGFTGDLHLRIPSEPLPPPIQEPLDPPENPDVPVREPDPEDPGQI
jgi:hypothetical protein